MIHYQYKNSEILFIGINPHPGSFDRGVPFSNNKLFWYLLLRAGLIDETMDDLRDDRALHRIYTEKFNNVYHFGLLNVIERPTRDITLLKKGEEEQGRMKIQNIIKAQNPKVVCFIGKIAYAKYMGVKEFTFGWQNDLFHSLLKTAKVVYMVYRLAGLSYLHSRKHRECELQIIRHKPLFKLRNVPRDIDVLRATFHTIENRMTAPNAIG